MKQEGASKAMNDGRSRKLLQQSFLDLYFVFGEKFFKFNNFGCKRSKIREK